MRTSEISRKTAETDIRLSLNLDGDGTSEINTYSFPILFNSWNIFFVDINGPVYIVFTISAN